MSLYFNDYKNTMVKTRAFCNKCKNHTNAFTCCGEETEENDCIVPMTEEDCKEALKDLEKENKC